MEVYVFEFKSFCEPVQKLADIVGRAGSFDCGVRVKILESGKAEALEIVFFTEVFEAGAETGVYGDGADGTFCFRETDFKGTAVIELWRAWEDFSLDGNRFVFKIKVFTF